MLKKLRYWALRLLGGVDRRDCVEFADKWLHAKQGESLGSYSTMIGPTRITNAVIYGEGVCIHGAYVTGTIAVAPWSTHVTIADTTFEVEITGGDAP